MIVHALPVYASLCTFTCASHLALADADSVRTMHACIHAYMHAYTSASHLALADDDDVALG